MIFLLIASRHYCMVSQEGYRNDLLKLKAEWILKIHSAFFESSTILNRLLIKEVNQ